MKKAIFPGSFDPLTLGHLDIIQRASKLFDEVYVVILENSEKQTVFTLQERLQFLQTNTAEYDNVYAETADSLTVEYARQKKACAIVRGVRSVEDYEYELNIASANQFLDASIETVLLITSPQFAFVSSSLIREMMKYHADVSSLVSEDVYQALIEKYIKS